MVYSGYLCWLWVLQRVPGNKKDAPWLFLSEVYVYM